MATRPDNSPDKATIVYKTVETTAVVVGCLVKMGSTDDKVTPVGAVTDLPFGIVTSIGGYTGSGTAITAGGVGDRVGVALLCGGVVPVKTGGTATRGQSAVYAAAGGLLGDGTPSDTTPTYTWSPGYFTQSGSSGDMVGLALVRHSFSS
jgi:hypothetical protein